MFLWLFLLVLCPIPLYFCPVVSSSSSSSLFFFSLAYSQPSQIACLPYFHTWCGLSANLGCRSETCCMWLTVNTGCKQSPKIRHLGTTAQLCPAIKAHIDKRKKKLVKQQYLPHMSSQYGELWTTNGTPPNFNGFRDWQRYCMAL